METNERKRNGPQYSDVLIYSFHGSFMNARRNTIANDTCLQCRRIASAKRENVFIGQHHDSTKFENLPQLYYRHLQFSTKQIATTKPCKSEAHKRIFFQNLLKIKK